jgi:hypothetical protein
MHLCEEHILQREHFTELTGPGVPADLEEFTRQTPLWYYCLKEAEHFGQGSCLGPVGGRIVAEVLLGLPEADPSSYLCADPHWTPEPRFGARIETDANGQERLVFEMADLLAFATAAPHAP